MRRVAHSSVALPQTTTLIKKPNYRGVPSLPASPSGVSSPPLFGRSPASFLPTGVVLGTLIELTASQRPWHSFPLMECCRCPISPRFSLHLVHHTWPSSSVSAVASFLRYASGYWRPRRSHSLFSALPLSRPPPPAALFPLCVRVSLAFLAPPYGRRVY